MNKEKEIEYPKIRELTRKDRKTFSALIQAFANRSGNIKLTEMVPAAKPEGSKGEDKEKEADTDKIYELIKSVMAGLLEWAEDEVAVWFMDLIGVTDRTKYDALPFDIEMNIIDQLMESKGFTNFFLRASELFSKIRGLTGKL